MPSEFTVSDHLLQRLQAWNVRRIFAYPGDGINGILGALRRVTEGNGGERFDVVQVAHEELAGLMATALIGLDGIRVEKPDEVVGAWERALASDRPFVIDAVVDRNVPTLPPQLKPEQEDKLTRALANGDADAEAVLDQLQLQEVTQR